MKFKKLTKYAFGNGLNSRIYRCNNKICKFKCDFQPSVKVFSSVTKRTHGCILPPGTIVIAVICDMLEKQFKHSMNV